MMRIFFSEKLKSLAELMQGSKRNLKESSLLEINYKTMVEPNGKCAQKIPVLVDWFITNFDNFQLEIFLNLTHPVYVSSEEERDQISIRVNNPHLF